MSESKRVKQSSDNSDFEIIQKNWFSYWDIVLHRTTDDERKKSLIVSNAGCGEFGGIVMKGHSVIEVLWDKSDNLDLFECDDEYLQRLFAPSDSEDEGNESQEMELIIVNIVTHKLRILMGREGNLREVNLSFLKRKGIIHFAEENKTWKGQILGGKAFGYGRMYRGDLLEYEGWMINGKKRIYGTEYWEGSKKKRYTGCYFNHLMHGYGTLYNKRGAKRFVGLFKDGVPLIKEGEEVPIQQRYVCWKQYYPMDLTNHAESISIEDYMQPRIKKAIFNCPLSSLKKICIGNNCLVKARHFIVEGLNELETIEVGDYCFQLDIDKDDESDSDDEIDEDCTKESSFPIYRAIDGFDNMVNNQAFFDLDDDSSVDDDTKDEGSLSIKKCNNLKQITIGKKSFIWYSLIEFKNLPHLKSIQVNKHSFEYFRTVTFYGMKGYE